MQPTNQDKIGDLQRKLTATSDLKERSSIRNQIQQLRDEDGSGLRRSRRFKGKVNTSTDSSKSTEKAVITGHALPASVNPEVLADIKCMCGCDAPHNLHGLSKHDQTRTPFTNNQLDMNDATQLETKSPGTLEKPNGTLDYDVRTAEQAPGSEDIASFCDATEPNWKAGVPLTPTGLGSPKENTVKLKDVSSGQTAAVSVDQTTLQAASSPPVQEERRSSKSAFSFFRGIRTSSSSNKDTEPPLSSSKEDQNLGKRRFSKRFRRRSTKSEHSEAIADNQEEPGSNPASSAPDTPRSESDSSGAFSPRSTSSGESQAHKKSARVVLRALGKRLFTAKQKSPGESITNPQSTSGEPFATKPPEKTAHNLNNSNNRLQKVDFSSTTATAPPKSASEIMAEVLARSRDSARATSSATVYLRQKGAAVNTPETDYESKTLDELQNLLDGSTDFEIRARIRKAIRTLKKAKEENASSTPTSIGNGSPAVSRSTVLLSAKKPENSSKPWEAEAKKGGFRSVSSVKFTPTSKPRELAPNSAPSRIANDRENSSATPVSRLTRGRELSASLRTYRPTYKAPQLDRGGSLKLARPKDFIGSRQESGESRQIHYARKVSPERVVLESVTSTDNVRPSLTLNKEESPTRNPASSPNLKRSESCKENQESSSPPPAPSIPVVQGNKRRSLGILGRVLSVKIDSQNAPRREKPAQDKEEESPRKETAPGIPVQEVAADLPSLQEEVPASLPALQEEEVASNPPEEQAERKVTQTSSKTIVIGAKSPEKQVVNFVPVTEQSEPSVSIEVTCSFSPSNPVAEEVCEDKSLTEEQNKQLLETVEDSLALEETETAESVTEIDGPVKDTTDSLDRLHSEVEEILGVILDQIVEASDEEKSKSKPEIGVNGVEESVAEAIVDNPKVHQVLSETFIIQIACEEAGKIVRNGLPSNGFESQDESPVESEEFKTDSVEENEESEKVTKLAPKKENLDLPLEEISAPNSHASKDKASPSSHPNSDEDTADEEDMEARVRSRFGGNGGSVKSRIQAREENNNNSTTGSPDVSKLRRQRQAADARALRGSEGVKSRLNKFSAECSKGENAKPNGSVRTRALQNGSVGKTRPLAQVNGSVKMAEVNNNEVAKSPTLTTKFAASKSKERSSSPLEKLESASLTIMDEMQSLSRETPVRRSRRDRLASSETTVTTVQSKTVVKAEDGATKVEITFESQEVTSETVVSELPRADDKAIEAAPLDVPSESASPSHSQRSSTSLDDVQVAVAVDEIAKVEKNDDKPVSDDKPDTMEKTSEESHTNAAEVQLSTETEPRESEEKGTSETRSGRRRRSDSRSTSETVVVPKADTPSPSTQLTGRRRRRARKSSSEAPGSTAGDSPATSPETEAVAAPSDEAREKPDAGEAPARDATPEDVDASPGAEDKAREGIKADAVDEQAVSAGDDKAASGESENTSVEREATTAPSSSEETAEVENTSTATEEKAEDKTPSEAKEKPADKPDNMRYSIDNLADITEEAVLEKLLDEAPTYEERRSIRGALRELRKKKRDGGLDKAKDKTPARTITTNGRLTPKSDVKDATKPASGLQRRIGTPLGGNRANKTSETKSLSEKYSLSSNTSSTTRRDMSSSAAAGSKKIGSIFDRGEDDAPKKSGSRLDLERRQAERRRDLQRNRSMPATSTKDARKMFAKMDIAQSGESKTKKVGRSPTFVVPNANNVKQMLLKWCQAKTRGYEHVDINNFSGSWANGMAFCALVHNFFPQAFDYNELDPKNRAHNFDLAFKTAHEKGDIPELLDTEDLVRMREPDWKCVYTYIMEFYKQIRELGMT